MQTKTTIRFFTIADYEKEQDYLREMHKSGWKFVRVSGPCLYHFEECEPEDVIYQLDFNQDGLAQKEEYVKMFQDCGWEYLQDYMGYSYFRKPASENTGTDTIFCDDESRLQMFGRVFKSKVLPLLVLFLCLLVPGIIRNLARQEYDLALIFGILICLYLLVFISYARQYLKLKNKK